ncbi:TPA: hypothetical protein ACF5HI_004089 [Salmonella enterica]
MTHKNPSISAERKAIILAWVAIALALLSIAINVYDKYRAAADAAPEIQAVPDVRTYGFICNTSNNTLFEMRREKIDVIEYVSINGNIVNCTANQNDIKLDNKGDRYLMNDNGFYIINGNKIPRKDVYKEWDNKSINKAKVES